MPVKVVAIGKKHEPWLVGGIHRYEKRLQRPFVLEWTLLQNSPKKGADAAQEESEVILRRIEPEEYVVLLDERGVILDSPTLSQKLTTQLDHSKTIVCVIGSAYGVSEALQQRANLIWSLSLLVFPHQLVRLLLVEQIYRAQTIAKGLPYHNS